MRNNRQNVAERWHTDLLRHVRRTADVVDGLLTENVVGIVHALSIPCDKHGAVETDLANKHVCAVNIAQIARVVRML
jgi:hypothetical protein